MDKDTHRPAPRTRGHPGTVCTGSRWTERLVSAHPTLGHPGPEPPGCLGSGAWAGGIGHQRLRNGNGSLRGGQTLWDVLFVFHAIFLSQAPLLVLSLGFGCEGWRLTPAKIVLIRFFFSLLIFTFRACASEF